MDKPSKNRFVESEFVAGGVTAGLIGGILMAILEGIISTSNGRGFFAPLVVIDGAFRGGQAAMVNDSSTTGAIVGFVIHMIIAGCLGGVFAIGLRLLRRLTGMIDAFWAGLAYGAIVWGAVGQVLLLDSRADISTLLAATPEKWFLAHVLFGATLGLTPVLAKLYVPDARKQDALEDRAAA